MNHNLFPERASDVPWPTHRVAVPDTSMLRDSDGAGPESVETLMSAVEGADDSPDTLSARAAPAARELGEDASTAGQTRQPASARVLKVGDEWADGVRDTVRKNPLATVAAAVTLGVLLARIVR